LNTHGFIISTSGSGSLGNETNYFGQKTKTALIKFQLANKITPAVGYFGPITRDIINRFLNISTTPKVVRSGFINRSHTAASSPVSAITDTNVTLTHGSVIFGYTFESEGNPITYSEAKLAPYYLDLDASTVTLVDGLGEGGSLTADFNDLNISDAGTVEYENLTAIQNDFPSLYFVPTEILIHLEGATSINEGRDAWTKDVTVNISEEESNIFLLTIIKEVALTPIETDYTPDSWTDFETALAFALALPETTNEEISDKIEAIFNALMILDAAEEIDPTLATRVTFALTTPTPGIDNEITTYGSGATKQVTIDVEYGTTSVVFTVTKLAGQTITVTGAGQPLPRDDSYNVSVDNSSDTVPIYTVNTVTNGQESPNGPGDNVSVGGNKTFLLTVSEEGKTDVVYTVRVQVAYPVDFSDLTATIDGEFSDGENRTTYRLSAADYTVESWQAYVDALDAGMDVEEDTDATQEEVDDATLAIDNALQALVSALPQ
jgi:hypothetical protein